MSFFNNNICYQQESSVETRLAYRHVTVKSMNSAGCFVGRRSYRVKTWAKLRICLIVQSKVTAEKELL